VRKKWTGRIVVLVWAWPLLASQPARPADLKRETSAAFDRYIRAREGRLEVQSGSDGTFLWVDESPARRNQVRQGKILVQPVIDNGQVSVPDGLIHDWIGAMFVPGAVLEQIFAVVHDYNAYTKIYKPAVLDSKLLSHEGNQYSFFVSLRKKALLITAVYDVDEISCDFALDRARRYNFTRSTRIVQVENFGKADERKLPVGQGSGFVWRLNGYSRFEQRDGGVYVELEAIALSRDVPFLLRWLVNPVVRNLSRESLFTVLKETREMVLQQMHPAGAALSN
jgi:hypothetical protein